MRDLDNINDDSCRFLAFRFFRRKSLASADSDIVDLRRARRVERACEARDLVVLLVVVVVVGCIDVLFATACFEDGMFERGIECYLRIAQLQEDEMRTKK